MRGPWFLTAARDVSYTHDQRGNLTYDGTFTYTYNAAGRLVQAESITNTVVYTYNGNGVRVATAVDGIETRYVQDISIGLEQVLVETTGENVTLYTYGIARLAQVQGSAFEWFLGDALGSVRQVVDNSGDVLLAQGYTPFGLVHSESGTGSSGYGFTGEQADPTGLVYLRARYYDPRLGRFVGVDLFPGYAELPATLHGYLYCLNNPVNAVDPGGLQGEPWWARAVNPEYNPITATVVRRFAEGGLAWAGISDLYRTSVQYTASALREGRWDDYMRGTMGVARMNVTLAGAALFTAGSAIVGYYTTPIRLAVVDIPLWIKSGSEWLQGKGREWDVALTSLTLGLDAWGTYKMASCPRTSGGEHDTSPHNSALYEQYKVKLRAQMEKPYVRDPDLQRLMDKLYRPGAQVGSGSTADAIRYELRTGKPVEGVWHSTKGEEFITALTRWLKQNPNALPGDRAAAENVILDLRNALGK
jgi:RHS repeat-associated protein